MIVPEKGAGTQGNSGTDRAEPWQREPDTPEELNAAARRARRAEVTPPLRYSEASKLTKDSKP